MGIPFSKFLQKQMEFSSTNKSWDRSQLKIDRFFKQNLSYLIDEDLYTILEKNTLSESIILTTSSTYYLYEEENKITKNFSEQN